MSEDVSEKKEDICGKKTEIYARIVGYIRPVQNWNWGKKEEFGIRKMYSIEKAKDYVAGVTNQVEEIKSEIKQQMVKGM